MHGSFNRESLWNHHHIPPSVIRIQGRQSIEIQAEYDAQIPPRLNQMHANSSNKQAQYKPQIPPNLINFRALNQAAFNHHIPPAFS